MSKNRYQPRLKKGVLNEKNYLLIPKNLKALKKKKWATFLENYSEVLSFTRNDVFLIHGKVLDLRKCYKMGLFQKQKFFAFFSNFRRTFLKKLFQQTKKNLISTFVDCIELRLDMSLFRANFVNSLYNARFVICRGLVFVNGTQITSFTYNLKVGDIVEMNMKDPDFIFSDVTFNLPTAFLEVNYDIFTFVVLKRPSEDTLKGLSFYYTVFFNLFEIKNFKNC